VILGVAIGSAGGMIVGMTLRVQIGWIGTIAAGMIAGAILTLGATHLLRRVLRG
jgi:hypothetical protein